MASLSRGLAERAGLDELDRNVIPLEFMLLCVVVVRGRSFEGLSGSKVDSRGFEGIELWRRVALLVLATAVFASARVKGAEKVGKADKTGKSDGVGLSGDRE